MQKDPTDTDDATLRFKVVVNHEEQYSIWPATKMNAPGWFDAGFSGSKSECLQHISEVWLDMRPRSLREQMQANDPTLSRTSQ